MGQYQRSDFSAGWSPSFDAFNCPKNGLLRADNLVLDELGALALRQGSIKINGSAFSDHDVHSLFTTSLSGTRYRMSGVTNAVYANGTSIASGVAGSEDISFGAHMGQILFARSTTKKKFDGTTVRNLGIAAPAAAPTLTALAADTKTFSNCNTSESPGLVIVGSEGSVAFVADRAGTAASAFEMTPDASSKRVVAQKTFTGPTDFTIYDALQIGTDEDPIEFYLFVTEPQYIDSVTVMVDVNDATYQEDYYEHTFRPGEEKEVVPSAEESISSVYTIEGEDRDIAISKIEPRQVNETSFRGDKPVTNTGWNHFSLARGQWDRHGSTVGKGWATVIAVRLVVTARVGGATAAVRFDDIRIIGGAARPLTGKYKGAVVAVRNDGTYEAKSPPSAFSAEIEVKASGIRAIIDATTISSLDSQVNELWLYLMGGRLNAFYRFATSSTSATSAVFDYTAPWETDQFTSVSGLANHTAQFESAYGGTTGPASHNYVFEQPYLLFPDPLIINTSISEITALAANLRMETDNVVPPDDVIMIEGPHFDRTLYLTASFIYPSRQLNPDSCSAGEVVRVGDASETALWIKRLGEASLYVGTTRDIYRFDGDWTIFPDGTVNVVKRPMHVSEPPVSSAVEVGTVNGSETLIYLSGDGWHALGFGPLVNNSVDLLWRGYTRHGVDFVNITGADARFRCAVSKNVLFALTPEGTSTTSTRTIHAYHFGKTRWYRLTYPQDFRSIYGEADGTLIAGDTEGFVRTLDLATKTDDGADIPVVLWTPADDNGQPWSFKGAENFWTRIDTGGDVANVAFHLNGDSTANVTIATSQETTDTGNQDVSTFVAEFTQLQLRVYGNFNTFIMRGWGLTYLDFPSPQVVHDTGMIDLSRGDTLKWVAKLRIKARSPVNLQIQPYWDGVAANAHLITVRVGAATTYDVPLGRTDRARVGRVVITSTSPSHIYWVEFHFNGSGKPLRKSLADVVEVA